MSDQVSIGVKYVKAVVRIIVHPGVDYRAVIMSCPTEKVHFEFAEFEEAFGVDRDGTWFGEEKLSYQQALNKLSELVEQQVLKRVTVEREGLFITLWPKHRMGHVRDLDIRERKRVQRPPSWVA